VPYQLYLVPPEGFEPPSDTLEECCLVQLDHSGKIYFVNKCMPTPNLTYENFPHPPEEVIKAIYECARSQPNTFIIEYAPQIKIYDPTAIISKWVSSIFDFPHKVDVRVISGNLDIHTDLDRTVAYNYHLETGGSNVTTDFYDSEDNLVDSYVVPEKQWVKLNVTIPHAVNNIEKGKLRIGLSVYDIKPELTRAEIYKFIRTHYRRNGAKSVEDVRRWMAEKGVMRNKTK
jgi:hypothetical protein